MLKLNAKTSKRRMNIIKFSKSKQKKWTDDDDDKLIKIVNSFKNRKVKWFEVSKQFDKTTLQCYSRYRQINPRLKKR